MERGESKNVPKYSWIYQGTGANVYLWSDYYQSKILVASFRYGKDAREYVEYMNENKVIRKRQSKGNGR